MRGLKLFVLARTVGFALLSTYLTPDAEGAAFSSVPDPGTWGTDGIIYDMVRIGDVLYVGGSFSNLVSRDGLTKFPASGLAAIDINTGLPTGWRPTTDNGTIQTLAISADQSTIYAGGAFGRVNGQVRAHFAAIGTNGVVAPWTANIGGGAVRKVLAYGTNVYICGTFDTVLNTNRFMVAAFSPPPPGGTTASLLPWAPSITDKVINTNNLPYCQSMAAANGQILVVGRFNQVNGHSATNETRLDAVTGAWLGWQNSNVRDTKDCTTDGTNWYIAYGGGGGVTEGYGPNGNRLWTKSANGDNQAISYGPGQVVMGGHYTKIDNLDIFEVVLMDPATGKIDTGFAPDPDEGIDRGVWAVKADASHIFVGGGFQYMNINVTNKVRVHGYSQFSSHDTVPPTVPANVMASATGSTQVSLRWTASTDNLQLNGYELYRGGVTLAVLGPVTNYIDNTATPATTYQYQVRAFDFATNYSALSSPVSVTTPLDSVPPTVPTNLVANVISETEIDLTWGASTDNLSLAGYDVMRDGSVITNLGLATSFADTSVYPANTYTYSVRARDSFNNLSDPSNPATASTPTEAVPPTIPSGLTAIGISPTQVNLNWGPSTDNFVLAGYLIYRDGALLTSIGTVTNYSDTMTLPATTYSYQVRARDGAGNLSDPSNLATATTPTDTQPPSAPVSLTATAMSPVQIKLAWGPSVDNVGVVAYDIYRNSTLIGSAGTATNYLDATVAPATNYIYFVRARDAAGNLSDPSNSSAKATPPDTQAPSIPTNFTAIAYNSKRADLAWKASTDDVGVVGYDIFRNNTFLLTIGSVTNYSDTMLPKSTNSYKIRARDFAGNLSGFTSSKQVITKSLDTTKPSSPTNFTATSILSTQVALAWKASTDNRAVVAYDIYRNSGLLTSIAATNYLDATVLPSSGYSYFVKARDADGNVSDSSVTKNLTTPPDTTAPTPVNNLTAIASSATQVNLAWFPATDNVAVTAYDIYRNGSPLISLGTFTNYSDTTVSPNTLYNYQVRARDIAGNVSAPGNSAAVTTLQDTTPPSAPTNLTAVASSPTRVDLAWDAATDNIAVTGYLVYRDNTAIASLGATTSYSDNSDDPSVTYAYTVRARDGAGNNSPSSNIATLTTPPDTEPPMPAPTNLTATAVTPGRVDLNWTAASDNGRLVAYQIFRDGTQVATTGLVTNYFDLSVLPLTSYEYLVKAVDAGNNLSDPSNIASVTTPPDTTPPNAPSNLATVAASNGFVNLTWTASTDDFTVAHYEIYRDGSSISTTGPSTNYLDSTTVPAATYSYQVRARDEANNLSDASNTATVTTPDTVAPSMPLNFVAFAANSTRVDLRWDPATDNVGVIGYVLYRDGLLSATLGAVTNYSDLTVAPSTTYNYAVRALDAANNVSPPNGMPATTPGDTTPPTAPTNVTATATGAINVMVSWSAATDNFAVTGYDVYRNGAAYVSLGTVTNYADNGCAPNTTYGYQLRARDAAANVSALSALVNVTTPKDTNAPAMPIGLVGTPYGSHRVDLTWQAATDDVGVTGYRIIKNGTTLTNIGPVISYSDAVLPSSTNNYRVRAFDAAGNLSVASSTIQAVTPALDTQKPTTPTNLTATAISPVQVNLTWVPSVDNLAVVAYDIYRNSNVVASIPPQANYSDTNVLPVNTYSYFIKARDGDGNVSNPSNTRSVTTPADTTPPSAPGNLAATPVGLTEVDLSWGSSTDIVGVTAYVIARNGTNLATVGGSVTNYNDTGTQPGTAYSYQVKARDAANNFSAASTVNLTTPSDTMSPSAPTNLTAVAIGETKVNLAWGASTDNLAVTGYLVYRNTGLITNLAAVTSFSDTSVSAGTLYNYQVKARDASNNLSDPSNSASVTTADNTPPSIPTNLSAVAMSAIQVDLNWQASTDNVAVTAYDIFRAGSLIASVGAVTNYSDLSVIPSVNYAYQVRARDAANNLSGLGNVATATTPADTQPPSAPTNLTAIASSPVRVDLNWGASTDNVMVVAYQVYRGGTLLSSNVIATIYSDTTALPQTSYSYQVRARDLMGNLSQESNQAVVTTPADTTPPSAPTNLTASATALAQVQLGWTGSLDDVGVTGYNLYRGGILITNLGVATNYLDITAISASNYTYTVRARDAANNLSEESNVANVTTPDIIAPNAPINLTATALGVTQILLGWDAAIDNVGTTGYDVYRDDALLASLGAVTNYQDNTASPATSYNYQLRAHDSANNISVFSATITGTTSSDTELPTAPTALTATVNGGARADLAWGASADNVGVTGYVIYRNSSALFNVGVTTNYTDVSVLPTNSYNFQVRARDGSGNLSDPSNIAIVNLAADTTAPNAPGNLVAIAVGSHRVDLSWPAAVDNVGVTQYQITRNNNVIALIGAFTNYTDNGVLASSNYFYKVKARDAAGNTSIASKTVNVTTPAPDATAPGTPNNVSAVAVSATQIRLSWKASTDNVGVFGYDIYRGGNLLATVGSITNTIDSTVLPNTTYSYQLKARDGDGNVSGLSSTASATTPADSTSPTVPANLTATALNSTQINLAWTGSTDDVAVTGYELRRNGIALANLANVTAFADTGLSPATTYHYQVRARDAAGNFSGLSNMATRTTPPDLQPPSVPTNVIATAISATQVNLGWNSATDNIGVTGYQIVRDGITLSNVGLTTNFSDSTVAPFTGYNYQVRARDGAGNFSALSSPAAIVTLHDTTPPSAPTNLTAVASAAAQVDLGWAASTDNAGVVGYEIDRNGSMITNVEVVTSFSDRTVLPGTFYSYQVRAFDAAGNFSGFSNPATATTPADTTPPTIPVGFTAIASAATAVDLSWTNSTDDVAVTGYDIYRDSMLLTSTGTGTLYRDTTVAPSTSYNYQVRARDAAGNISDPAYSTVTTLADTLAPTAPANLLANAVSSTQVDLSWDASADDVGVTSYEIYRDGLWLLSNGTSLNSSDSTTVTATTYSYTVRARDAAGNLSQFGNSQPVTTP